MFELQWHVSKFKPEESAKHYRKAAARALYLIAEDTMTRAKQICPFDTGNLRSSGRVMPVQMTATHITVTLAFGGPKAPYAWFVHENLTARHAAGTTAKYLERPLLARARTLTYDVAGLMASQGAFA